MQTSFNSNAESSVNEDNGKLVPQRNDTAGETGVDEQHQNLNEVINSTEKTPALIHQLYITVSSFTAGSQLPLLERINALAMELENMAKLSDKGHFGGSYGDYQRLIDDGKNPDLFTRDLISSCIAKNQTTKGKTDIFKTLREHLLDELDQAFPDDIESYREIRAASSAEQMLEFEEEQSILPNGDVNDEIKPEL